MVVLRSESTYYKNKANFILPEKGKPKETPLTQPTKKNKFF
jgi:hypothetical protein